MVTRQVFTFALLVLLTAGAQFACGDHQRNVKSVMKVYDKDPKAFRRKLNTRLPDD